MLPDRVSNQDDKRLIMKGCVQWSPFRIDPLLEIFRCRRKQSIHKKTSGVDVFVNSSTGNIITDQKYKLTVNIIE